MPRFIVKDSTQTTANICVKGRVTLHFMLTERGVRKVGATAHDRKPADISRQDFLNARTYAIGCMAEKKDAGQLTNLDIARILLRSARMKKTGVEVALNNFLKSAKWCSKSRRYAILQEVGSIGSKASRNRAQIRVRAQKRAGVAARQLPLL